MSILRLAALTIALPLLAQQYDPALYSAMRWRQIGPFRAGRVTSVAGIPGNAAVYYMGTPGGGVWKTVDAGVVWTPIFDQEHVASIGAIAVAPSKPEIVYVGTGDVSNVGGSVNQGNGVYKSIDAGKTWQHVGLDDTRHIGAMWIDPHNPDVVLAAALGHTFSPNTERGVFKTTDGGKTWRKVLYKDDTTGAIDIDFAPDNPKIGFAALWYHYVKPGGARSMIDATGGAGIYKTADGGDTWTQVTNGLPTNGLGRIGVAVAPGGKTVFAIVAAGRGSGGLYRSDDGGDHWQRSTPDPRIQGSGYFSRVFLDPKNSNIVYVAQTSLYRSEDGGHTFSSYKGAPGGDDNHALWIDPTNSDRMIMASDQGATISMDAGKSWSSWYNQPTAQIYHLSTDNRFPYWVYGTQQDSGSVATLSRGDYGEITFMDWDPIGGYEFGYIIPDPLNPNLVYAGGPGRGLVRLDRTNRQIANISPNVSRNGDYRTAVNPPLAFSPHDPHLFYEGTQFLLETRDGGVHWRSVSPDLTKRPGSEAQDAAKKEEESGDNLPKKPKVQEEETTVRPPDRSAINTFSLSPVTAGVMWAGTTNGLIQLTKDGGAAWQNVSPAGLSQYALVSIVEASHFDAATAYACVDRHEENDFNPHIYRTRDAGKTWTQTIAGLPAGSFVRVVREDPTRKGLLYAGTESATFVSFDDGDHWGPLQLNMPTTSVRDLVIHGSDLVAATYGRSFWILDDLTPLRQMNADVAKAQTFFYRPDKAIRVRLDLNGDTPLPPEMPAGQNPPNGALIDYYLRSTPSQDIALAIYDASGRLVREFSSKPEPPSKEPPPNVPDYWLARPEPLSKGAGAHRFVWDLHYPSPPVLRHDYPISALYANTPGEPLGALALPGQYEVRLMVNGRTFTQPLEIGMDPRVDVTGPALAQEFDLEQKSIQLVATSYEFHHQASLLREAIATDQKKLEKADAALKALKEFDQKVQQLQGAEAFGGGGGPRGGRPKPTFALLNRELGSLATVVDAQDAAPTPAMQTAYDDYCHDLVTVATSWNDLLKTGLPPVNDQLSKAAVPALTATPLTAPACK
ncbi:MAG TPA: hypothetical protein VEU96_17865 [Bryobacteraceae bacterium]|nr:hypothetical protein [Bryobacteraceae bacterium]